MPRACAGLERLGFALDPQRNLSASGEVCEVGRSGLAARVLVVRADEELQIAREALITARVRVTG